MKKISISLLLMLMATLAFAQKPSVTKAQAALQEGNFAEALSIADAVVKAEEDKLRSKGKDPIAKSQSYYMQGKIYHAIATNPDPAVRNSVDNPIAKAIAAYDKVVENHPKSTEAGLITEGGIDQASGSLDYLQPAKVQLYNDLLNMAADEYNKADNMAQALKYAEMAIDVMPEDTTAAIYATQFAYEADDKDKVIKYSQQLINGGHIREQYYTFLLQYAMMDAEEEYISIQDQIRDLRIAFNEDIKDLDGTKEADKAKAEQLRLKLEEDIALLEQKIEPVYSNALVIANDFKEYFPSDPYLMTSETNIYLRTGKTAEAIKSLEHSLSEDEHNKEVIFNLGVINDQIAEDALKAGKKDVAEQHRKDAIMYYTRALEEDPNYYNAHLNLAALYYNTAREMRSELSDLETMRGYKDEARAKVLISGIKDMYAKAIPAFQKAKENQPESDRQNLDSFVTQMQNFNKSH